jgi:threonine/homoserine/homoserine lactone efflux protein
MILLFQFLSIIMLGFIGGAVPGSILTSAFTETVRKGFIKSLRVILYAFVSEIIVALCIMFIFFSIRMPQSVFYGISFIGALVLVWIAIQIWSVKKLNDKGKLFDFKKIFLLTIFNGPLWIFWSTICVPQAYLLNQKIIGGQLVFLILFEFGWLSSTLLLTFLFSRFRPLLIREGVISKVFKTFALVLSAFAIRLIITSIFFFFK